MAEVRLDRLTKLTSEQQRRLSALGLESVEELLARCKERSGQRAMAKLLGLDAPGLAEVLKAARGLVSRSFLAKLAKPTTKHKRGALIPTSSQRPRRAHPSTT